MRGNTIKVLNYSLTLQITTVRYKISWCGVYKFCLCGTKAMQIRSLFMEKLEITVLRGKHIWKS